MQDHPKGASEICAVEPYEEDERSQLGVLRAVLDIHPATLTQDELIRLLSGGRLKEFSEIDRVERAVRELSGDGLLHRPGEDELVRPTRAAVRYFDLSGGGF